MSATKRLVVISDLHAGCRVGLCPPHGVTLDDGGQYFPSALQMKLWQMWRSFWDEFVPEATRGKPFDLVVNGDAIDGVHHGSTTQVSHNLADQLRIAHEILEPVVRRAENYYHVRGTEAHAGKSGATEEELARSLGAVTNRDGQSARFELWKRAGRHLVHVLHHLDGTGRHVYRVGQVGPPPARRDRAESSSSIHQGRDPDRVVERCRAWPRADADRGVRGDPRLAGQNPVCLEGRRGTFADAAIRWRGDRRVGRRRGRAWACVDRGTNRGRVMEPITIEELLAEWESTEQESSGWTARELCELWGCNRNRVHGLLNEAKRRGRLVVGRKRVERIDGKVTWRPAYSITPAE